MNVSTTQGLHDEEHCENPGRCCNKTGEVKARLVGQEALFAAAAANAEALFPGVDETAKANRQAEFWRQVEVLDA